jgi:hemophore-related protein
MRTVHQVRQAIGVAARAGALAGGLLFGIAPSAAAAPTNCTAADLAGVSAGVSASTAAYLFTHPDVNAFLTGLAGSPRDSLSAQLKDYLDANPTVRNELGAIRQPLVDLNDRCGTSGAPEGTAPAPAADSPTPPAPGQAEATVAQVPRTNAEIRQWYNDQVAVIPQLNEGWLQQGLSADERARLAADIRHSARLQARNFMQDKQEVADLQARDLEKYGNPDGPTFEQLVEKNIKDGLQGDAVYEAIISSSNRTSQEYNQKFGINQTGQ